MTRFAVVGLCPLPFENTAMSFGPGIRTWQIASGLAADGHEVSVVAMAIPGCYGGGGPVANETVDGITVERWSDAAFHDDRRLAERLSDGFEAVVGATIYGSEAVERSGTELPFWGDQFGHVMAEAQAKAALDGHDRALPYFWRMTRRVGLRADHLSAVSERQRYALIGELGALGRLTAAACGEELVSVVPCAVVGEPAREQRPTPVRGAAVPDDAFVVLWSGSYNVWSDVDTVFRAVDAAMGSEPRLHFLSTGGAVPGHDDRTYERFRALVAGSRHRGRFHLRGWIPAAEIPAHQEAADLGVLAERPIYEGILGSKNRIVQWMGGGLPVAYNRVGDLGDLLHDHKLGLTFDVGDADALAERILWASRNPARLAEVAERARAHAELELSFAATTRPLRRWASEPRRAPTPVPLEVSAGNAPVAESLRARVAGWPALRRSAVARKLYRMLGSMRSGSRPGRRSGREETS